MELIWQFFFGKHRQQEQKQTIESTTNQKASGIAKVIINRVKENPTK
jgi:hypothetical protein